MTPLQKLEARLIRNHQIAEALLAMTPQTPVNIPLLTDLLKSHPNQNFVANLTAGLTWGFRVGYQGNRFPKTAKNLRCATALCRVLTLFEELNIPLAPKKTFRPTQCLEFMGITLDSVRMEARLPGDKLHNARLMLASWSSKRFYRLHDLQSLIGTLHFVCRVISPGRPFMQRIINLTRGVRNPGHFISLNQQFRKDILMWQLFLDHWNGVSLFLPPFTEPSPQIHLLPMLQVPLAMGVSSITFGSRADGPLPTSLTLPPA